MYNCDCVTGDCGDRETNTRMEIMGHASIIEQDKMETIHQGHMCSQENRGKVKVKNQQQFVTDISRCSNKPQFLVFVSGNIFPPDSTAVRTDFRKPCRLLKPDSSSEAQQQTESVAHTRPAHTHD